MISVIVPVYNVESYISNCIESILGQTFLDLEILLIDDGSTDRSGIICDLYASDDRVKVFHRENHGVSASRNYGMRKAKGEYITFVDSDDWLEPDYLKCLWDGIVKGADVSCCNCFVNQDSDQKIRREYPSMMLTKDRALDCYSVYYFTVVWGKLYKKDVVGGIKFAEDLFYSEDTLFYTEVLFRSNLIYFDNKPLYHYRDNPSGAMRNFNPTKSITDFEARKRIIKLYDDNGHKIDDSVCRAFEAALSYNLEAKHENKSVEMGKFIRKYRMKYLLNSNISLIHRLVCFFRSL